MSTTGKSKGKIAAWCNEIDCSIPPFSYIKEQSFADKCIIVTFNHDDFIIDTDKKGTALDGFYIVAEGIVGIGDSRKGRNNTKFWIERTTVSQGAVIGELEVPLEIIIGKEKHSFTDVEPTQSAWPSSNILKWFAAYGEDDRKLLAKAVKTLKIPLDSVNGFMKVPELKEWVLFDQFRKARQYFLDIEYYIYKSKKEERTQTGDDIVIRSQHLYNQRKAVGCAIKDAVYIIGINRYEVLIGSKQLVGDLENKNTQSNLGLAMNRAGDKRFNFNIKKLSPEEFMKELPEDKKSLFYTKKGRYQKTSAEMTGKLPIASGEYIFRLSPTYHV